MSIVYGRPCLGRANTGGLHMCCTNLLNAAIALSDRTTGWVDPLEACDGSRSFRRL